MFDLTPAKGSTFLSGLTSAQFTAKPRTTSTLEAVDSSLYYSNGDLLGGFFGSGGIYDPQRFRLTAKDGTVYLLDRTGGLISATDRNGNTLTVDAKRDHLVARPVDHVRARQPRPDQEGHRARERRRSSTPTTRPATSKTVTDPNSRVVTYEYDAAHNLKLTKDPLNRPFQTLTYVDGRLESVTDALGNEVTVDVDPDARTETVIDAEGRLTTISTLDERGNVARATRALRRQDRNHDIHLRRRSTTSRPGRTRTATPGKAIYDEQDLRFFTDPTEQDDRDPLRRLRLPDPLEAASRRRDRVPLERRRQPRDDRRRTRAPRDLHVRGRQPQDPDRPRGQHLDLRLVPGRQAPERRATRSITSRHYTYDDSGRLLTETDATGRTTAYTYWPDGSAEDPDRSRQPRHELHVQRARPPRDEGRRGRQDHPLGVRPRGPRSRR